MSKTKIKYKGVTTIVSDMLFEDVNTVIDDPVKSNKFTEESLYYNGIYYFPNDIIESDNKKNTKPFEIQGIYYRGKWIQDTFYIDSDFRDFLLNFC
ncbi:hypothetical protein G1L11_12345 [Tenacibaculum finnmarkense]|uniref:hypothetical protein n=1 Tax=Tenacibaculum finnmarkense TaxID=2781243 RepID=UPI001EFBC74B|nr:hypothetical protein [Tenacibaculum finnmarkense]MCG8857619.1 hypothetical protein [Tenacibaculum finnmarkense]